MWSSGSQLSHEGRHQFHLPRMVMAAGTTTIRIRVASTSKATPTPKPHLLEHHELTGGEAGEDDHPDGR